MYFVFIGTNNLDSLKTITYKFKNCLIKVLKVCFHILITRSQFYYLAGAKEDGTTEHY